MNDGRPALSEYLYAKASRGRLPLSGTLELTPVCNLDCRMCYVRKSHQQVSQSARPILTLEQWLEVARAAKQAGTLYLLLTGGEPFLWPDFWQLYEELVKMGFLVSINTNATLIDEETVARLKKLPPRRVNVTLYGACDETYERLCGGKGMYPRVDKAIRDLQNAGIQLKLNGSFTPHNACDMEAIAAYARSRNIPMEATSYMFPPVRRDPAMVGQNDRFTPEEAAWQRMRFIRLYHGAEEYTNFLRGVLRGSVPPPGLEEACVDPMDGKIRCMAGKASFWITWDGWMTPCGMMPSPRVDVAQVGFDGAWQALTAEASMVRASSLCDQCGNRTLCHPCVAIAAAETGETTGIPKYLCESTEALRAFAWQELENDSEIQDTEEVVK